MGKTIKQTSHQRRHQYSQQAHEIYVPIINKRNANQDHNEHQFTFVRMEHIKKTRNKGWWGSREKGTLLNCWVEIETGPAPKESNMEVSQNIKNMYLPSNPAILLWGSYPKHSKTLIQKETCTPMFKKQVLSLYMLL